MSNESKPAGYGSRPPFYKRQYIVDKPFQYRLIGTLLCIWAANTIFFTLVLYLLYDGQFSSTTSFAARAPRSSTRSARVKKLREMKEAQLGVSSDVAANHDEEAEPVSLAVH